MDEKKIRELIGMAPSKHHPTVSIIILNWNGKQDTLECLESVKKIDYPNLITVIIDNGSVDGSQDAFKHAHPWAHLIETGENLGFAEGNNVGIRYALDHGTDYVFILNNDTIVDPHVLTPLVEEAERNPKAAILSPKIYFYDRPDVINSAGGHIDYETMKRGHIGYGFKEDGKTYSNVTKVEWSTGCALLFSASVLKEVGLFNPDYFLICEELDLCARVKKRGYDILFVPDSRIWHKVSAAFEGNYSPVYCYYMYRNVLLYVRKNCTSRKLNLYKKLIGESHEFYRRLKSEGDKDYRKKGFCILMGTIHFFLGRFGKAPSWIFRVSLPVKTRSLVEENHGKDLFKAEITVKSFPQKVKAGSTIQVPVRIQNISEATWPAFSKNAVRMAYHLYSENGDKIVWDGLRTNLPNNLPVGRKALLNAKISLPDKSGKYIVELDLVQENIAWFGSKGSSTAQMEIAVT